MIIVRVKVGVNFRKQKNFIEEEFKNLLFKIVAIATVTLIKIIFRFFVTTFVVLFVFYFIIDLSSLRPDLESMVEKAPSPVQGTYASWLL